MVETIVSRCAALDVHKDTVMACVRLPDGSGGRAQVVREFQTFTVGLRALRDWLVGHGVRQVAMDATGVYWKPVWIAISQAKLHRRFGNKGEAKAAFVGHAILVIAWHLLHDERDYEDLGADYLDSRNDTQARIRYLVRQIEQLGHTVTSASAT